MIVVCDSALKIHGKTGFNPHVSARVGLQISHSPNQIDTNALENVLDTYTNFPIRFLVKGFELGDGLTFPTLWDYLSVALLQCTVNGFGRDHFSKFKMIQQRDAVHDVTIEVVFKTQLQALIGYKLENTHLVVCVLTVHEALVSNINRKQWVG
jgi:hypothetical protein